MIDEAPLVRSDIAWQPYDLSPIPTLAMDRPTARGAHHIPSGLAT